SCRCRFPTTSSRSLIPATSSSRRPWRAWWGRSSSSRSAWGWRGALPGRARGGSPRMRLWALGRYSEGDGPLPPLHARVKLVATLASVGFVVATPIGSWRLLAGEGLLLAFVVGLSGVPPRSLLKRWLAFLLLVAFLAVMVAQSHPRRAEVGAVVVGLTIV